MLSLKEGDIPSPNALRGMEYWEQLARWIDEEPVEDVTGVIIATLRSIGIEKGKPFRPDDL